MVILTDKYNVISDPLCISELKYIHSENQKTQIDNYFIFFFCPNLSSNKQLQYNVKKYLMQIHYCLDIYLSVKVNLCSYIGVYGIAMSVIFMFFSHIFMLKATLAEVLAFP